MKRVLGAVQRLPIPGNKIVFDGESSYLGVSPNLYLPRYSREASRGFEGPYSP